MSITDERLKVRASRAISLQEQGCFIIDQRKELPLPRHPSFEELRYSRERDEKGRAYDYENVWGCFSYARDDYSLLILRKGSPPVELVPQPRLEIATARMHTGFVTIHNNGTSFDLDLQTRDRLDYGALRLVNQTLVEEQVPIVVWKMDSGEDDTPPIIRIANDSALLFASSAIWSPDDQQLVAAQVVTTSQELLKAIKASLAKNNGKEYLTVKTPDDSAYLKSARRGYVSVNGNLIQANAEGTVTAMLHPLSGDPQAANTDYFYIVAAPDECLAEKFAERLDLAIPWPVQAEWAEYLLEAGKRDDLVQALPASGTDFTAALRVVKSEGKWQQIITDGLRDGCISIQ